MFHENIFEVGKHAQNEEYHNPLELEAELESGDFHESVGRQRLGDEVVLPEKHKDVAYNLNLMRVRLVVDAGAEAEQPCLIHNHLSIRHMNMLSMSTVWVHPMWAVAVPLCDMVHEKIFENGRHEQDEQYHNPLETEAESESGDFHESVGWHRLEDEVVLSKKHNNVAYNLNLMRVTLVMGVGAEAAPPCMIHNRLLIRHMNMMPMSAVWVHPMLDAASSSSFELPPSPSHCEDEVSVLEVQWLEYDVKLAGVWEEDAARLVWLYWLNEYAVGCRGDEVCVLELQWLEYDVKLDGVWEENAAGLVWLYWLNDLAVDFHESVGWHRLEDEVVLSKKHNNVAYNLNLMRVTLVMGVGDEAAPPCMIHNRLLIRHMNMMPMSAVWVHPMLDAASSSSFELPPSPSHCEDEVSVLEVQWLEYDVKLAGVWEEDAARLVWLYWLNEYAVGVPWGEMLHENIFEVGKHEQNE
ncbi:Otu Domain-Containing Protein 5 [Manis pentadactyla]|nr:Otu Domain-Containing Protein 5 [Manis pentadactyla]